MMTPVTTKRIFIGGLAPSVTEDELGQRFGRFGEVSDLQLKIKEVKDMPTRTFAHLNLSGETSKLTQCMTAYNNCQWKGYKMTVQWAKDNFMDKLKSEVHERRLNPDKPESDVVEPKDAKCEVAGARPGKAASLVPNSSEKKRFEKTVKNETKPKQQTKIGNHGSDNLAKREVAGALPGKASSFVPGSSEKKLFETTFKNETKPKQQTKIDNHTSDNLAKREVVGARPGKASSAVPVFEIMVKNETKPKRTKIDNHSSDNLAKRETKPKQTKIDNHASDNLAKREIVRARPGKTSSVVPESSEQLFEATVENDTKPKHQTKIDKHASDNQRRLASIKQKEAAMKTQKKAVQHALSSLDTAVRAMNKKIKFDSESDDESESEDLASGEQPMDVEEDADEKDSQAKKVQLFGDSSTSSGDSDDEIDFRIRPQFEGASGERLMKLQASFKNDHRFKMDERFVDNNVENDEKSLESEERKSDIVSTTETSDERTRNLRILESVLGKPVLLSGKKPKVQFKDAVRYDPSRDDHESYLVKTDVDGKSKKEKKKKSLTAAAADSASVLPAVSNERFYEVESSTIKSAMKNQERQQAVFNFFGEDDDDIPANEDIGENELTEPIPEEKPMFCSKSPFDDEASSESEREIESDIDSSELAEDVSKCDSFFPEYPRMKEGIQSFVQKDEVPLEEVRKKWLDKRNRLIDLYKTLKRKKRSLNRINLARNRSKRAGKAT